MKTKFINLLEEFTKETSNRMHKAQLAGFIIRVWPDTREEVSAIVNPARFAKKSEVSAATKAWVHPSKRQGGTPVEKKKAAAEETASSDIELHAEMTDDEIIKMFWSLKKLKDYMQEELKLEFAKNLSKEKTLELFRATVFS